MTQYPHELIRRFEQLVRRDPASRGLIGGDGSGPGIGELLPAAELFGEPGGVVGIVTGFFIPHRLPPHRLPAGGSTLNTGQVTSGDFSEFGSAETDGPPGAAVLAAVLLELGFTPRIITDEACRPVVEEAARSVGLPAEAVTVGPMGPGTGQWWVGQRGVEKWAAGLTHLVAIERVGPSHHRESIGRNDPEAVQSGDFERDVPETALGRCFNMRGEAIDHFTAALHELFPDDAVDCPEIGSSGNSSEAVSRNLAGEVSQKGLLPRVATVGVGDGGNEIGMGRFAWSMLRRRIRGPAAAHIPCRIATDRTIVAGTSNLGAYALAASIAALHQRIDALREHSCAAQQAMLGRLVVDAGAVDGVTRRSEPTVDGVPFVAGIQPWACIRRELGLPE